MKWPTKGMLVVSYVDVTYPFLAALACEQRSLYMGYKGRRGHYVACCDMFNTVMYTYAYVTQQERRYTFKEAV